MPPTVKVNTKKWGERRGEREWGREEEGKTGDLLVKLTNKGGNGGKGRAK